MKIAFVADPLNGLDPSIDTTVGLMHAAQDLGAEVWVTRAQLLEAAHGRARAHARRVRLAPSRPRGDHRWTVARRWFTAGEPQRVWLDDAQARSTIESLHILPIPTPEQIAPFVVYLASNESAAVTGTVFPVDAGYMAFKAQVDVMGTMQTGY